MLRSIGPVRFAQKHAVVRIPVGRFDFASRALDFGAEAVIAPMVNSIEDARRFVAAMKYPPVGERSWGPARAMEVHGISGGGNYLAESNRDTLAFAMIETREALAIVDDILALDGIDGVFVGPSDFSIAWTRGSAVNPNLEDMMGAVGHIAARATAAGKLATIYAVDMGLCGRYEAMGYRLFATGAEPHFMALGAAQEVAKARASMRAG